jgi:predicted GTPase
MAGASAVEELLEHRGGVLLIEGRAGVGKTSLVEAPFHRNQISADHVRIAEMTALREGRPCPRRTRR